MGEVITAPEVLHVEIGYGLTVTEMLDASNVPQVIREFVVVHIDGQEVAVADWSAWVLEAGQEVEIFLRPAGDSGKEILRLIATIAIIVVAWKLAVIGGAFNTAVMGALGVEAATAQIIIAASITAVGTALLNAFIPPPSVNLPTGGFDTGESYFLNAQSNAARPYAPVPVPYGRVKMIGNLAAQPEIFSAGDSSLFTTLIDWGLGQSNVFNYRAGDSKLQFFQAVIKEHTNVPEWQDPSNPSAGLSYVPLELLKYPLNSVELSVGLSSNGDSGEANTVPTAYSAVVELLFPQGISYFDDQGNAQNLGVTFKGTYRKAGDTEWLPWPSGTQGYAGDSHIYFGQGTVGPDPNPNTEPNVDFNVPLTEIDSAGTFVATITFDREVYAVDFTDFVMLDASTGANVTGEFQLISESEITPTRVWQYELRAPSVADDVVRQFIIGTNLQNFIDQPPPYGDPFPDKVYESNAFTVAGADVGGGTGPAPDNLYDRTAGNETYVFVSGFGSGFQYVQGDKTTWQQQQFQVWVGGVQKAITYGEFDLYAGTFQTGTATIGFSGIYFYSEWWSLKRADGSANNRFINLPPNWGEGTPFLQTFTIYGNKPQPARASIEILFAERGEYEIRIQRIGDNSNAERPQQYVSSCYWSRLASRGYPYYPDTLDGRQSILNLQRRHTMTEIRLEASENVQGNLNEISATVVSQLRGHNGTQWTEPTNSRNPAWIVADILLGYRAQQVRVPLNLQDHGGYLDESQLDLASFRAFSRKCMELVDYTQNGQQLQRRRYEIDLILASDAPVIETVQNILSMCRARLILNTQGKLEIMMDVDRADEVRQVFTPANSWGFKGERIYQELPHGLRVSFIAPELGYQRGTVEIFRPPYTKNTAVTFEDLETFGCTNWHMAAQYGMYVFGQMILRTETFTLSVAAESIVVQNGDVVEIANDTAALGGGSHLITEMLDGSTMVLSEEPNIYSDPHYTLKTQFGVIQGRVLSIVGRTVQIDKIVDPLMDGSGVGIVVIGEKNFVTKKYIIKEIRPQNDLSAELTLVPYDPNVYLTDNGSFPEWNAGGDGNPQNPENGGNARTIDLTGFTFLEYDDRQPISVSDLSWDLQTADAPLSGWKVQWTMAGQDAIIDIDLLTADKRGYQHKYNAINGEFGAGYYVVTPISQLGYEGEGAEVFVGKSVDRIPPPPPERFRAVAYPTYIRFNWQRSDCPDLEGYTITMYGTESGKIDEVNVSWRDEQFVWFIEFDQRGASFEMYATDTSGNNSETVFFNGLISGLPYPPLVVPFYYEKREFDDVTGETTIASVNWKDVLSPYDREPSRLIAYYELRFDPNPKLSNLTDATFVDNFQHPSQEIWRPAAHLYPEIGTWYISAVDHFNRRGPWNKCSSDDKDYTMSLGYDQEIKYHPIGHPLEREPFSEVDVYWEAFGTDDFLVVSYKLWMFPRQPEFPDLPSTVFQKDIDKNCYFLPDGTEVPIKDGEERYLGAVLYYDGPLRSTTLLIDQLPNYRMDHQGTFIIEGLVADGRQLGTRAKDDWQMIYDRTGPAAPTNFVYEINPNDPNQLALEWDACPDPDIEYYEIRYTSRVDGPWETSMIIGQPDFYHVQEPWRNRYIWFDETRGGKYMIRGIDTTGNIGQMSSLIMDPLEIDPNAGWELIQSIEGHDDFDGVLDGLYRIDGSITIMLDPAVPMVNGKQTAYFYYNEDTTIPLLAETRIVSETLEAYAEDRPNWEYIAEWPLLSEVENMAEGGKSPSNVELVHEVKLPNSQVWQQFGDSEFPLNGTVEYRIQLTNDEQDGKAGIRRSRILVYAEREEVPLRWPTTVKTTVIPHKK